MSNKWQVPAVAAAAALLYGPTAWAETRVHSVYVDIPNGKLLIDGSGFTQGLIAPQIPYVEMSGVTLVVSSYTNSHLEAVLPSAPADGEYQIFVSRSTLLSPPLTAHTVPSDFRTSYSLTFGTPGPAGPQGVPGPAGPTGAAGAKGATGLKGDTGLAGAKGDTGASGATGPKGDKGETGAQGVAGATGPKGDKGDAGATGVAGPDGAKGDPGAQGLAGATGPKGDKGDAGATGAAGPEGAKGDTGVQGLV